MSQYVDFYLKSNSDEFLPIGDYGRSSMIYKYICDYVPYEKITPITTNTINEIISNINSDISCYSTNFNSININTNKRRSRTIFYNNRFIN